MSDLKDLIGFMAPDQRMDLKSAACMSVAQLTGTPEGLRTVYEEPMLVKAVVLLIKDKETFTGKDAMRTLVNISAEEKGSKALLHMDKVHIVDNMVECIRDAEYEHADFACGVLANLSRTPELCSVVLDHLSKTESKLEGLVFIFCQPEYNKKGAKLNLLAPVITNIAQISEGRSQLMNKEKCIFQRLLPFTEYTKSEGRRKSIIAAIHNCCFEKDYHDWLLSDEIDLISHLCLPLAGPDVYTIDENESLPLDLQFLPDDKMREKDVEIRTLLLESLMQLGSTKQSRKRLRDLNVYLILRELHKCEENEACTQILEDVVNLLIRTEEEIGFEDLTTIEIPSDLSKKFSDFDLKSLKSDDKK